MLSVLVTRITKNNTLVMRRHENILTIVSFVSLLQNSTEFLLARLERQNNILDNDPKSVCIQSNTLKANFETVQSLIDDINTSPTNENDIADLIPILKEEEEEEKEASKTIDWDFWSALIQDYSSVATKLPLLLSAKLQQGLPPKLRGLV